MTQPTSNGAPAAPSNKMLALNPTTNRYEGVSRDGRSLVSVGREAWEAKRDQMQPHFHGRDVLGRYILHAAEAWRLAAAQYPDLDVLVTPLGDQAQPATGPDAPGKVTM